MNRHIVGTLHGARNTSDAGEPFFEKYFRLVRRSPKTQAQVLGLEARGRLAGFYGCTSEGAARANDTSLIGGHLGALRSTDGENPVTTKLVQKRLGAFFAPATAENARENVKNERKDQK
jgi:hypothetical protein